MWAVDTQPGTVHGVDVVAGVDALRGVPDLALSHQPPMTWIPGMNNLLKLNTYLRTRGTSELVGLCLEENIATSALARRAGFEIHPQPDGLVMLSLPLRGRAWCEGRMATNDAA